MVSCLIVEGVSKNRNSIQFKTMYVMNSEKFNRQYSRYIKKGSDPSSRGSKSSNTSLRNDITSNNSITQGENTVNPSIRESE